MTREEKKQILEEALERAVCAVKEYDAAEMETPGFRTLLKNIMDLEWLARATTREGETTPAPMTEGTGVAEPQNQEAPDAPEAPAPETPTIKMEEVRAALAKARGKGVNVAEIIRGFGVDTFPQIDKTQYPAVLAKLEEALNAT